jgi:hypothetical protein
LFGPRAETSTSLYRVLRVLRMGKSSHGDSRMLQGLERYVHYEAKGRC